MKAKKSQSIWKEFSETCQPKKEQMIIIDRGSGDVRLCRWYNDVYISNVRRNGEYLKNIKWVSLEEIQKL